MPDPMYEETLCTAHRKNGAPCRNYAMRGTNVCRMHGGSAPQVRRAAGVRILMAADKAAARLVELMQDKAVPYPVQLAAARDLLDRAGLASKNESVVTVEVAEWEKKLQRPVKVEVEYLALPPGYDENGEKIGSPAAERAKAAEESIRPPSPKAVAKAKAAAERSRKAEAEAEFIEKQGKWLEERMFEPKPKNDGSYRATSIKALPPKRARKHE